MWFGFSINIQTKHLNISLIVFRYIDFLTCVIYIWTVDLLVSTMKIVNHYQDR